MDILLFLIPIALGLGVLGFCTFLWCMKNKQFDDLEGDACRILIDDEPEDTTKKS